MIPKNEKVKVSMVEPWDANSVEEAERMVSRYKGDMLAVMRWLAGCLIYAGWKHDNSKQSDIDGYFNALVEAKREGIDVHDTEWYKDHFKKERSHLDYLVPEDVDLLDVMEFVVSNVLEGADSISLSADVLAKALANTFAFVKAHVE